MVFSRISWVGLNTDEFDQTVAFFADVVGLRLTHRDNKREVAHFRLFNGDMFEVFGPRHPDEVAPEQKVSIAFEVEDLEATRIGMESRGAKFITETEVWKDHAWCYFQGPDGLVYEIKKSGSQPRS